MNAPPKHLFGNFLKLSHTRIQLSKCLANITKSTKAAENNYAIILRRKDNWMTTTINSYERIKIPHSRAHCVGVTRTRTHTYIHTFSRKNATSNIYVCMCICMYVIDNPINRKTNITHEKPPHVAVCVCVCLERVQWLRSNGSKYRSENSSSCKISDP